MTEWTMRRRSSSRCSRRLMPGSSARSDTAALARSTRSAMVNRGLLAFSDLRARSVFCLLRGGGLLFLGDFRLVAGIEFGYGEILVVGPVSGADRLAGAGGLDNRLFWTGIGWSASFGRKLGCVGLGLGGSCVELLLSLLLLHGA